MQITAIYSDNYNIVTSFPKQLLCNCDAGGNSLSEKFRNIFLNCTKDYSNFVMCTRDFETNIILYAYPHIHMYKTKARKEDETIGDIE